MAWEPLHAPEAALESEPLFLLGANGGHRAIFMGGINHQK